MDLGVIKDRWIFTLRSTVVSPDANEFPFVRGIRGGIINLLRIIGVWGGIDAAAAAVTLVEKDGEVL